MNVIFKNILIVDIEKKTARKITLHERFNIFTSSENHVGKSSLLKSLYYTLGADVFFDDRWKKENKFCSLDFNFNEKNYTINRLKTKYCIFENDKLIFQGSETKNIIPILESIFNFTIYLRNKNKHLTKAYPVLTYLPYYIDQDSGWEETPFSSFITGQYDKKQILHSLYYHLGLQEDAISDAVNNLKSNEKKLKEIEDDVNNEKNVLWLLLSKSGQIIEGVDIADLEKRLTFSKEKIESVVKEIIISRNRIQKLQSELVQHQAQLKIIADYSKIKSDLSPDKKVDQTLLCPNCGYNISSNLYDMVRKSYSVQNENYLNQQIIHIVDNIKLDLKIESENYLNLQNMLKEEEEIKSESKKPYLLYITQRGLSKTIMELQDSIGTKEQEIQKLQINNKILKKLIDNSDKKKEIDIAYKSNLNLSFNNLGIPLDEMNDVGLMKLANGQGTLSTKIILAQYLALFKTMEKLETNAPHFPFVVDSPKAKEAVGESVNFIFEQLSYLNIPSQIIISTVEFDKSLLKTEMSNIHTTVLSEKFALLNSKQYAENENKINDYLAIMNHIDTK